MCLLRYSEIFLILEELGRLIFLNIYSSKQIVQLMWKYFNEIEFSGKFLGNIQVQI